jgi:hypothetical protein
MERSEYCYKLFVILVLLIGVYFGFMAFTTKPAGFANLAAVVEAKTIDQTSFTRAKPINPEKFRFYTHNFLFENATVVVRDKHRRTVRATYPSFKTDYESYFGDDSHSLLVPVKDLDLTGSYDIVIHFKSGAVSRYKFSELPTYRFHDTPDFYLHVCGPDKTLYAAVALQGVNAGHRYSTNTRVKLY